MAEPVFVSATNVEPVINTNIPSIRKFLLLHGWPSGLQDSLAPCSRWAELTDALKFHADLARTCSAPTEFRLLNGAAPFLIGVPNDDKNFKNLTKAFNVSPGGGTPLCRHIREVIAEIRRMEPQLRANHQKAAVMLATDGESSDGDIAEAMRPLKDLPVWVVIRLCTDEDHIVEYWNNIDSQL
eukprot:gene35989-44382_t